MIGGRSSYPCAACQTPFECVHDRLCERPGPAEKVKPATPRLVIVESPFAGDVATNRAYAVACVRDCLLRGEAPFASHLLYTEALDDTEPSEREHGITAGFAWRARAAATVVYTDRGISGGMQRGIEHARTLNGHAIEYRSLPEWTP